MKCNFKEGDRVTISVDTMTNDNQIYEIKVVNTGSPCTYDLINENDRSQVKGVKEINLTMLETS